MYLVKHWRGELPWAHAALVNGLVLVPAAAVIGMLIANQIVLSSGSLWLSSLAWILWFASLVALFCWAAVGIWRTSNQVGLAGKIATRTVVAAAALGLGAYLVQVGVPQTREFWSILRGDLGIENPAVVEIIDNGRTISLRGGITAGTASRFQDALVRAREATLVALDSGGGRIGEATQIADMIQARGMNTLVERSCLSACTHILLAGTMRSVTPNARIGFHQPSFPGWTGMEKQRAILKVRRAYLIQGLSPAFIDRIMAIPADDMWLPTYDELRTAGVVNQKSLGGETSSLAREITSKEQLRSLLVKEQIWAELERKYPDVMRSALERGWAAKQKGATDGELMTALRQPMIDALPRIYRRASDAQFGELLDVTLDQIQEAAGISDEACVLYLAGKLNATTTLSSRVQQRELALMTAVITGNAPERSGPSPAEALPVLAKIVRGLPPQFRDPVIYPQRAHDPQIRCESFIAFLGAVAREDAKTRALIGRQLVLNR